MTQSDATLTQSPIACESTYTTPSFWLCVAACLFFILAGLVFIPYAGIQADEALFTAPIYAPADPSQSIRVGHSQIPLMLMSYLGTLKTAVYAPLLNRWRPGPWSLRLPVLLAGAITIWLFGRLTALVFGGWAAAGACVLLACDPLFLLTTVYDWGPVAFQHLLLAGGVLGVVCAFRRDSNWGWFWPFVCFGLAMWDKALAAWMLGGLSVAALLVYPGAIRAKFSGRRFALVCAGFLLGALPLVRFNLRHNWVTFRGNAHFSNEKFGEKAELLKVSLQGGPLFGYIARDEWEQPFAEPHTPLERASFAFRGFAGERRFSLQFWALIAALAAVPLWWTNRKPVLFATIAMAVAWLQMAFTKDAGGGAHHTSLLWPLPQFILAGVLAGAVLFRPRMRVLGTAVFAVVAGSSLLVTHQYAYQLIRNGTSYTWTDAIAPLYTTLTQYRSRPIAIMDWGIGDPVRAFDRGRMNLLLAADTIAPGSPESRLLAVLRTPAVIFVTHTPPAEINPGSSERLLAEAAGLGYRRRLLHTVNDRNGRPVFEVSEFFPVPAP